MAGTADAERFARITAAELAGVGINMNLAPVLDVAPPDLDSVMAGRVFPGNPEQVARLGTVVIDRLQADGVMAVAKHFPGIGRTTLDSHLDLPVLDVAPDVLESDLIPFRAAVRCGVAGVMLSHIRYPGLDPEWPASLSTVVARDLLRRRFGYGGLVMTDDLDMGAIQKYFDIPTACGRILDAGIDLTVICHKGPAIETAFRSILDLQGRSSATKAEGAASADRILSMKKKFIGD
jgi:beta-N-acetylhexosaminidase